MAIHILLQNLKDLLGIDLTHSVITNLDLNFKNSRLRIIVSHYVDAQDYNDGKDPIRTSEYNFDASVLPSSVITDALSLKSTVESEMISNLSDYQGGTKVNDDGTSI